MHETPIAKITLNRVQKHVSVEGQVVVRTYENESLKYHKFQNVEKEVEDHTDDKLPKFNALIVRSRIVEIRRRNEKRILSSHERTLFHKHQQEKQTNGKGGGRQILSFIDGDVPLCLRNREAMIDEPKKVKGSSKEANEGSGSKER